MADAGSRHGMRWYTPLAAGTACVIVADQASKSWAVSALSTEPIDLPGPLDFRLAYNSGMAFSRGEGKGLLISLVGLGIVGFLVWTARTVPAVWMRAVMGVVAGGALGNIIDRAFRSPPPGASGFMRGAVVDFLYTSFWPTFNVADSAIVVGGLILAVAMWRMEDTDQPDSRHRAPSSGASSSDPR